MLNRILGAASIVGLALLIAAAPTTGQPGTTQPGTTQPGTTQPGTQNQTGASSQGYQKSMETMNQAMMKPMTGNADQDFVNLMIAHHQGAIDMAQVELQYGADPMLKQMAQTVVDEQGKEIEQLKKWQKDHQPMMQEGRR